MATYSTLWPDIDRENGGTAPVHYDLLIQNGTAVLPWGMTVTDIGVRDGRIAALGAEGDADAVFDASGLHVLPGLVDPHVHLRDPGDPASETIPTGTKAAVLGGLTAVYDMPNTSPAITDGERVAWKRGYAGQHSWCDFGIYVGATKANTPELGALELLDGVCAVKVFAGSSTGDLLIEDDASLERVMRSGRRRVAYHSEDEYRLQERRPLFHSGMPYSSHMEWRDEACALIGTQRLMALARRTGRPAHILHVSTAQELDLLRDHRDIATSEVLVNHLTQCAVATRAGLDDAGQVQQARMRPGQVEVLRRTRTQVVAHLAPVDLHRVALGIEDGHHQRAVEVLVAALAQEAHALQPRAQLGAGHAVLQRQAQAQRAVRVAQLEAVDQLGVREAARFEVRQRLGARLEGLMVVVQCLVQQRLLVGRQAHRRRQAAHRRVLRDRGRSHHPSS